MATIGFLSTDILSQSTQSTPESTTSSASSPILFTFDDKTSIRMHDAVHSTLILGSTGIGKTKSGIRPMLDNLFKAGYSGAILDVKGNMGEDVRNLLALHGRSADLVEIGSAPTAMNINILKNMSSGERREFLLDMSMMGVTRDINLGWYRKGGVLAADVADVLEVLSRSPVLGKSAEQFIPTLERINCVLTDWPLAAAIWELYTELISNGHIPEDSDDAAPFETIRYQAFHIFSPRSRKDDDMDFQNQLTWMLQGITQTLSLLKNTENLLSRFSCAAPNAPTLDFEREIYQHNRVVLVHFSPACGSAGELLSRLCKRRLYAAMYAKGLQLPKDRYTFFVGDEFQCLINLDDPVANDMAMFSVSREFRNINIIATQSVSSLCAKSPDVHNIRSLLSNCMNIICMQNTDTETQDYIQKTCMQNAGAPAPYGMNENDNENIPLQHLFGGKCYYRRYNADIRGTTTGLSSVNNAFAETRDRLEMCQQQQVRVPASPAATVSAPFARKLRNILTKTLFYKDGKAGDDDKFISSSEVKRRKKMNNLFIKAIQSWDTSPKPKRAPKQASRQGFLTAVYMNAVLEVEPGTPRVASPLDKTLFDNCEDDNTNPC